MFVLVSLGSLVGLGSLFFITYLCLLRSAPKAPKLLFADIRS